MLEIHRNIQYNKIGFLGTGFACFLKKRTASVGVAVAIFRNFGIITSRNTMEVKLPSVSENIVSFPLRTCALADMVE